MFQGKKQVERVLAALADQLQVRKSPPVDMLICGGAALQLLELLGRTTLDIDILAFVLDSKTLQSAKPFPTYLAEAVAKVGRDFGMDDDWLNSGPTHLSQEIKLPKGLLKRAPVASYGSCLTVRAISRYDQIHLKLFAVAAKGPEKHDDDLRHLEPTKEELFQAAQWLLASVNEWYREDVKRYLKEIGHDDVAGKL